MKRLIYLLFSIALILNAKTGYSQQNLERGDYYGEKEITAPSSIVLKPGFWARSGSDLRVFIQPNMNSTCPNLSVTPSNSFNNVLVYTTKIPGIKDIQDLGTKTICEISADIQYLDGFGRTLQAVSAFGSINQKDIVFANEFDWMGRQKKMFLPFESNSAGGNFFQNALTPGMGVFSFYGQGIAGSTINNFPYSETKGDNSPLDALTEQSSPGEAWKINSQHTIRKEYDYNNSTLFNGFDLFGSKRVAHYMATTVNNTCTISRTNGNKIYDDNQLYVLITKNENWKPEDGCLGTIEEYIDKSGKLVLKRVYNRKNSSEVEMLSTYYVYDQFGALCYVLPPNFDADDDNALSSQKLENLSFQYVYDYRNRLIEKKVPSKGKEYFVYNNLNQVVLTQDANQRKNTPQQWSFVKYDELGRPIICGVFDDSGSNGDVAVNSDPSRRNFLQSQINTQSVCFEQRNNGQANAYSNVAFPTSGISSILKLSYYDDYNIPGLPANFNLSSSYVKPFDGSPTVIKTNVLGHGSDMLLTVLFYNNRGENVKTITQHYKGGTVVDGNYNDYASTFNFQGQLINATKRHFLNNVQQLKLDDDYSYNSAGFLEQTSQKINDGSSVILSRYSYNSLGELIKKKLHSQDEGASFLQEIDYSYNERGWLKSTLSDLFKVQLDYNNPSSGLNPQFNGNISMQHWGTSSSNNSEVSYQYDKLNRVLSAVGAGMQENGIMYDKVGNIRELNRDNSIISYNYDNASKNKLLNVSGGNLASQQYQYDLNGNVVFDGSKGNINIQYNLLGQPQQITGANNIQYTYDADGRMLAKSSNTTGQKEYIDFLQYGNINNTYGIEAFKTSEGKAIRLADGSYRYQYDILDHLGNTRVTFDRDPISGSARRIQSDDYYAFGKRKSVSPVSLDNKYLYNGKEIQEELGEYDYGARFYNPEIGRWNAPDPLAEKYSTSSPYSYALNNPIYLTDPDGMQVNPWIQPIGGSQRDARYIPWGAAIPEGWMLLNGGDYHDFYGQNLGSVNITAKQPDWVTRKENAYSTEFELAKDTYRKRTGGLFRGYPSNVVNQLAQESFYDKYYQGREVDPFSQRVIGGIPLKDANWIIDIGVGGFYGIFKGAAGSAPLITEEIMANTADDALMQAANGGTTFYRAMGNAEFSTLQNSGGLSHMAGKELFVSSSSNYSRAYLQKSGYDVLVQFNMKPGAMNYFNEVGVMHRTAAGASGWAGRGSLLWKSEQGVMNLGIQSNTHMFNSWIESFKVIK